MKTEQRYQLRLCRRHEKVDSRELAEQRSKNAEAQIGTKVAEAGEMTRGSLERRTGNLEQFE